MGQAEPQHAGWPKELSNNKHQLDQFPAVYGQCSSHSLYPVILTTPNSTLRGNFPSFHIRK